MKPIRDFTMRLQNLNEHLDRAGATPEERLIAFNSMLPVPSGGGIAARLAADDREREAPQVERDEHRAFFGEWGQ